MIRGNRQSPRIGEQSLMADSFAEGFYSPLNSIFLHF
jgi:hypothetical protein